MINDFFKKNCIWLSIICVLLIAFTFTTIRLEYNRRLVSEYRTELGQSRDTVTELTRKQQRVEELTRAAVDYCNRNDEYVGQAVTTVRELRAQISFLEDYCYNLRDYIVSIRYNSAD